MQYHRVVIALANRFCEIDNIDKRFQSHTPIGVNNHACLQRKAIH